MKEHPGTSGQTPLRYIEATLADIEAANRLAHEVLGRSLDELPPQTRRLLAQLKEMVRERCEKNSLEADQCLFTRREVRRFTGLSNTQLKLHLDRLEDFEYILARHGMRGRAYEYELLFDGDIETEKLQLIGLIDAERLRCEPEKCVYDPKFTGVQKEFTGETNENTPPKRGKNAPFTDPSNSADPAGEAASKTKPAEKSESGENAHQEKKKRRAS